VGYPYAPSGQQIRETPERRPGDHRPRKVRDYLLLFEHPVGRYKAHFFTRLGFARENWQDLRGQLHSVALQEEAEVSEETAYGQ